jgi:hypothetical protein
MTTSQIMRGVSVARVIGIETADAVALCAVSVMGSLLAVSSWCKVALAAVVSSCASCGKMRVARHGFCRDTFKTSASQALFPKFPAFSREDAILTHQEPVPFGNRRGMTAYTIEGNHRLCSVSVWRWGALGRIRRVIRRCSK